MRHGAFDFITKPWSSAELKLRVERALRSQKPAHKSGAQARGATGEVRRPRKDDLIIGGSSWTKELYERISMVAPTDVTVAKIGRASCRERVWIGGGPGS